MAHEITKYQAMSGGEVTLSPEIIKQTLCPYANPQEIALFLELCKYQKLNPFLREVYLVKYGNQPASMVTGKETFTKRAESHKAYDGFEAGLVLWGHSEQIVYRAGSCLYENERLIGGWAKIHRKDWTIPVYSEVSLKEYEQRKKDGSLNKMWKSKPATMIRKVAIVQALRETFPNLFGGLYDASEIPVDVILEETPVDVVEPKNPPIQTTTSKQKPPPPKNSDKPESELEKTKKEFLSLFKKVKAADKTFDDKSYIKTTFGVETIWKCTFKQLPKMREEYKTLAKTIQTQTPKADSNEFNEATKLQAKVREAAERVKEINPTFADNWLAGLCKNEGVETGAVEEIDDIEALDRVYQAICKKGIELKKSQVKE